MGSSVYVQPPCQGGGSQENVRPEGKDAIRGTRRQMADDRSPVRTVALVSRDPKRRSAKQETPPRRRRADDGPRVLGVEIDGTFVAAVLVSGGEAQAVYDGAGATTQERLAHVVKQAGHLDAIRVALPLLGASSTPVTVTPDLTNRARFEQVAHRHSGTTPSTTVVAGVIDLTTAQAGQTAPGLALTAPRAAVEETYSALGGDSTRVALPVAHTAPLEGLSLALRYTHAEVTLVVAGRPVATHELPVGGLAPLDQRLGRGSTVGTSRLAAALAARAADLHRSDPDALAELEQYLRLTATQLADIVSRWTLAGHSVPSSVYVHGRGATADRLGEHLADVGLRKSAPGAAERALTLIEPRRRPALVSAYLAAAAHEGAKPAAHFVNPATLATLVTARDKRARSRRTRTLAAAAALFAVAVVAPLAPDAISAANSGAELDKAVSAASQSAGVDPSLIRAQLTQIDKRAAQLPATTAQALLTALSSYDVTELHAAAGQIVVDVRTDDPAAVLDALTAAGLEVRTYHHDRDATQLRLELEQNGPAQ